MHQPKKAGGQQLCNKNFARVITAIFPNLSQENLLFKDWIPIALDDREWIEYIDVYFEACKTLNEEWEDEDNTPPPIAVKTVMMPQTRKTPKIMKIMRTQKMWKQ